MTVVNSKSEIVYSSRATEFTFSFRGVRNGPFLVLCVVFCRSLFVLFLLVILFSVYLRFTASDYPFDIFLHELPPIAMYLENHITKKDNTFSLKTNYTDLN